MDDQFPPDQHSAKDDFVVPEAGPGEEAANFSAKSQQEKFLGGGASNKLPEASKGFLGMIAHGAKEAAISMAAGLTPGGPIALAVRERNKLDAERTAGRQELKKTTPTEASDAFLRDKKFNPLSGIASTIRGTSPLWAGAIGYEIAKGNYKAAAASGLILGASYIPEVTRAIRNSRTTRGDNNP